MQLPSPAWTGAVSSLLTSQDLLLPPFHLRDGDPSKMHLWSVTLFLTFFHDFLLLLRPKIFNMAHKDLCFGPCLPCQPHLQPFCFVFMWPRTFCSSFKVSGSLQTSFTHAFFLLETTWACTFHGVSSFPFGIYLFFWWMPSLIPTWLDFSTSFYTFSSLYNYLFRELGSTKAGISSNIFLKLLNLGHLGGSVR